jgi:riboflavin biosynthesis pyrimidine reductase
LAAAFLEAQLVDELILYVAPHFLGADAAPLAALSGLSGSSAAWGRSGLPGSDGVPALPRFAFREQRLIQNDLRLILTPQRA